MPERRWQYLVEEDHFVNIIQHLPCYKILSKLVAADAVTITAVIEDLQARGDVAYDIIDPLVDLVSRTDRKNHAKLAAFVLQYHKVTESDTSSWLNFRYLCTDINNSNRAFCDPYDEIPEEARQWENWYAFLAQLSALVYDENPTANEKPTSENRSVLDMTGFGTEPLGHAFSYPYGEDQIHRIKSEHATRCACWFLLLDSKQIWANCKTDFTQNRDSRRERPLWHFGMWRHWKQGVVEALERDFSADTKQLLRDTLAEMDRVDAEDVIPETSGKYW